LGIVGIFVQKVSPFAMVPNFRGGLMHSERTPHQKIDFVLVTDSTAKQSGKCARGVECQNSDPAMSLTLRWQLFEHASFTHQNCHISLLWVEATTVYLPLKKANPKLLE